MRSLILRPIRVASMQAGTSLVITVLGGSLISALRLFAAAGPPGGASPAPPPALAANQRIELADVQLRRQGWQPRGDTLVESFDRELAGNDLSSLGSCSGTGAGFCRYDYRRGRQQLQVITVPGRDGDGLVHHWLVEDRPGGRP